MRDLGLVILIIFILCLLFPEDIGKAAANIVNVYNETIR